MRCPKCGDDGVSFDGAFFKCHACGLLEWVKDWEKDKKRWRVGINEK